MNNFEFLKDIDKNLYEIISEAEFLYRDEYFEQSMTQIRRFGEIICKNVLGDARTDEKTFDDMLSTLKDKASNSIQEKEFVEDLYFIKKEGNLSTHSAKVRKNGVVALECLQRAFEAAINYAVYYKKANSKFLNLQYDTELLVTGRKAKSSLAEKYIRQKSQSTVKKQNVKKKNRVVSKKKKSFPLFWMFVGISAIISSVLVLIIFLLSFFA